MRSARRVNLADDDAGLVIAQTEGSTQVTKGGLTDTYTVALSIAPTSNVTVTVTANSQLRVASAGNPQPTGTLNLTFTPSNWNVAQVVTVSAVIDSVDDGVHRGTITHQTSSADTRYQGLPAVVVTGQIDSVLPGDFNSDQLPDLVQIDRGNGTLQVAQATATGLTPQTPVVLAGMTNWKDNTIVVADVTGDGRADVVGRDATTGAWQVARSTGSAWVLESWGSWDPLVDWKNLQVADFDGDHRQDLAARHPTTGAWQVALSTGTQFTSQTWGGSWSTTVTWVDVRTGDFNDDSRMDLAGRNQATGSWQVSRRPARGSPRRRGEPGTRQPAGKTCGSATSTATGGRT